MKTAILKVQSLDDSLAGFTRAWKSGVPEDTATIAFATAELMREVLTPQRLYIVQMLCGAGALSTGDIARRAGRDTANVGLDLIALLSAGVLERRPGGVVFPYQNVSLDLATMGTAI